MSALYDDRNMVCARCLDPYIAGHICNSVRSDWDHGRKKEHKCSCDTCYAAYRNPELIEWGPSGTRKRWWRP